MSNDIENPSDGLLGKNPVPQSQLVGKVISLKAAESQAPANQSAAKASIGNFNSLPDNAFMRLPQVTELVSVSKPTIWRWCKEGKFPSPRKLSGQVTAWNVGEVRAWLGSHCAA